MSAYSSDRVAQAPGALLRIDAFFEGAAYSPHRHDTYAFALPVSGVQRFAYRGGAQAATPGEVVVLYPDELHDGAAGTDEGFRYRGVFIEPAALQAVYGGAALPFIKGGVSNNRRLRRAVAAFFACFEEELDPLEYDGALVELAAALQIAAGADAKTNVSPTDYRGADLARAFIHDHLDETVTLDALSRAAGCCKWSLSRAFKRCFGTSPYRYLIMRRLERASALLNAGAPAADAALAAGFADQGHFIRNFKRTYGRTPGQWRKSLS